MSTSKTSTSSATLAASERSGEAGNVAGAPPSATLQLPGSEVTARAHRQRFREAHKLSIIEQADSAQGAGAVGALLRREGLYSSHLATWRQQRKQGEFDRSEDRRV